jgi:uncharacterized membrane protein
MKWRSFQALFMKMRIFLYNPTLLPQIRIFLNKKAAYTAMGKKLLLVALLLLCMNLAYAAELKGTIYNSQLELQKDAIIEINTEPRQSIVSKDGTYLFNVPSGEYTLFAKHMSGQEIDMSAEEKISVSADGSYTMDLILFDSLEEAETIDVDITNELDEQSNAGTYLAVSLLIFLVAGALAGIIFLKKKTAHFQKEIEKELAGKKNIDEGLEKIVKIIKSEGGRTTQLEIRKHIPLSEAKISLMIAELEDKGIVRKIKKGRGNIILLNK